MRFDYFYGSQADSFAFYRIPRVLVTGDEFKSLSTDAKLLYGLMLDRMGLSIRNGWYDDMGRVFIYYRADEIQVDLNCGHDKALKLLAELDTARGIGLIERVKQGQGKPTIIYVKQFTAPDIPAPAPDEDGHGPDSGSAEVQTSEKPTSRHRKIRCQEVGKSEVKTSDNQTSRHRKGRRADIGKPDGSYNNINQTYESHTYPSETYPSIHPPSPRGWMDRYDQRARIKEQIDYSRLVRRYQREEVDSLVELITDTLASTAPYIRIGGSEIDLDTVKDRFSRLDGSHIEYVLDAMQNTTTKIQNIRAYLLTALYNAPVTIDPYYSAAVRHDFG